MSDALQRAVQKMRSSTKSLNTITDEIAETIQQVESFLNQTCSAGVYASVNVKTTSYAQAPEEYLELVYCRLGSRFRIAVSEWWEVDPESRDIKAWVECSRDIKLETAKKLPDLILEISKQIHKRIEEAKITSIAVSHVMSTLNGLELDRLLEGE